MDWGLGASAIKLDSILGHFAQESMKFPSRVLEGKIERFVTRKGLYKPLDEKWRCDGNVPNAPKLKFRKLDFGKKFNENSVLTA